MPMTNNGMDQKFGRDTRLGFLINDEELRNPSTGAAPIALVDNNIVSAYVPVANTTETPTILAQPDLPRNVIMTVTDADSTIQKVTAKVIGKDYWYNPITEYLTHAGGGTAIVTGNYAFREFDRIETVTGGTVTPVSDTIEFGVGNKLGLPVRISADAEVKFKREDANLDTTGVIDEVYHTWTPATVPDAANRYYVTIASRYGVVPGP